MKNHAPKTTSSALQPQKGNQPFFQKEGDGVFFSQDQLQLKAGKEHQNPSPFFGNHSGGTPFFTPSNIQPKLTIGQPGDKYEQEADSMADKVVQTLRQPDAAPNVQAKCAACAQEEQMVNKKSLRRQPEEEEKLQPKAIFESNEEQPLQRKCAACQEESIHPKRIQMQGAPMIQLRAAPYIKKISVHLTPPQTADLEWQGTPPTDAPGVDHFTVSTGKGYADPWDPAGTCTRTCCEDAMMQCAPPWNRPGRVGACCTFYGDDFWTGRPRESHNGWNWWTPIQPYYSQRGIALHQHTEVTGQPIGHGCVRMEDENAKRIHDFSNGRRTKVKIDGRAAPVQCEESQQCEDNRSGVLEDSDNGSGAAANNLQVPIPGMEGVLT